MNLSTLLLGYIIGVHLTLLAVYLAAIRWRKESNNRSALPSNPDASPPDPSTLPDYMEAFMSFMAKYAEMRMRLSKDDSKNHSLSSDEVIYLPPGSKDKDQ